MFLHVSVSHSVNRGVCLSECWDSLLWHTPLAHPPGTLPPLAHTPLAPPLAHPLSGTHTPLAHIPLWHTLPPLPMQSMLGDTVNALAVRILLECNLVILFHDLKLNWYRNEKFTVFYQHQQQFFTESNWYLAAFPSQISAISHQKITATPSTITWCVQRCKILSQKE